MFEIPWHLDCLGTNLAVLTVLSKVEVVTENALRVCKLSLYKDSCLPHELYDDMCIIVSVRSLLGFLLMNYWLLLHLSFTKYAQSAVTYYYND